MYDKKKLYSIILCCICAYCCGVTVVIAKEYFFGQTLGEFIQRERIKLPNISITSRTALLTWEERTNNGVDKSIGTQNAGTKLTTKPVVEGQGGSNKSGNTASLDTYKLCKSIAMHETNGCDPKHSGSRINNCVSIMAWDKNGKRYIKPFKSVEENLQACVKLWNKSYKTFPTYALAVKYSGNDNAKAWLDNVTYFYNNPSKIKFYENTN